MPYASSYAYGSRSTTDDFWCGEGHRLAVDVTYVRALTGGEDGEWNYLFSKRDNASDLYKGAVSITIRENTASNCVVIAPAGSTGNYWSATPYSDVDTAWCQGFDGPNINPTASSNRKYGNSIRPVFSVSK